VVDAIAGEFKVDTGEVLRKKAVSRNISIYLMKRHTGMSNGQIGELCGGLSYSAVAKACQGFSHQLVKDRSLREKIDGIAGQLSQFKT
jgi:chromosomal replication initiation ATPase DnaA